MMNKILLIIITISAAQASGIEIPLGWIKVPIIEFEKADSSYQILNDSQVIADFNGDNLNDHALVLYKKNSELAGIFIYLSNKSKHTLSKLIQINVNPIYNNSGNYFITELIPGKYKTPEGILNIKHSGIIREELEFGWRTMFWLNNDKWIEMNFARGDISKIE
jgi:hypothetical protein